jgi:hypothetical protein
MKRFKTSLALIGVLGITATSAIVATTSASAVIPGWGFTSSDPWIITLDCSSMEFTEGPFPIYSQGDDVTVMYSNCSGYGIVGYGLDSDSLSATYPGGFSVDGSLKGIEEGPVDLSSMGTFVVRANQNVGLGDVGPITGLYLPVTPTVSDPMGKLERSEGFSIPAASPLVMTIPGDPSGPFYLGGNEDCEIIPGEHIYSTVEVTIYESGSYTFRYVTSDPLSMDIAFWSTLDFMGMSDPYLAVYNGFNPADPESGVVGCNDDGDIAYREFTDPSDPYFEYFGSYFSQSGQLLSDRFSQFESDLEPGTYTLVLTSYGPISADDWVSNSQGPMTADVELWGPEGGFSPSLANTGLNPATTIAYSGILLTAGAMLLVAVIRRRRTS